jgi:alkanesulfonate monooxygenase SsuD/methylene tetrahydromethanopterin reductase-like flavin-dependent oxidoreductase (luciferase family)
MRFGLGPYELQSDGSKQRVELYDEMLEQAVLAEEVGFDSVWAGEGHFTPDGSCSSSETAAAAVAARTYAARIGVFSTLNLTNPLYIAEDIAVLDNIANGRVLFAAQRAGAQELAAAGIAAGEAAARFDEALMIIRKAWAPTAFSHQGKYWRVPSRNLAGNPFAEGVTETNVTPKPAQLSVPVWMATSDPAAVEQAARLGFVWLGSPLDTLAELKAKHEIYAKTLASAGRMAEGVLFPAVREVYVGETMQEARADVEQGLLLLYESYFRRGLIAKPPAGFEALARDRFIVGDVDHVISEIKRYQREAGINYLVCRMAFPAMSHGKVMDAIRFFGQAIVPEFRMTAFPAEIRKRTRGGIVA